MENCIPKEAMQTKMIDKQFSKAVLVGRKALGF